MGRSPLPFVLNDSRVKASIVAGAQASEEEGSPGGGGGEEDGGSPAKAKPLKKLILTYPGDKAAPGKARVVLLLILKG